MIIGRPGCLDSSDRAMPKNVQFERENSVFLIKARLLYDPKAGKYNIGFYDSGSQ